MSQLERIRTALLEQAEALDSAAAYDETPEVVSALSASAAAANELEASWSRSWIGYHANVYYRDFRPPPNGSHFAIDWGLYDTFASTGSVGDWVEYTRQDVERALDARRSPADESTAVDKAQDAFRAFGMIKLRLESILVVIAESRPDDEFIQKTATRLPTTKLLTAQEIVSSWSPKTVASRDSRAIMAGIQLPVHKVALARVEFVRITAMSCRRLAGVVRGVVQHLELVADEVPTPSQGHHVFIGHGRSPLWRELADFIRDRLAMTPDEFNRVPVAGMTTVARLEEMLHSASIAFVVLTAEDERADGAKQARMNVIHEAGLFQGRLGFKRAILLLEEGCEEFSNVHGLGQIRFPAGNISAAFEDVRRVIERERVAVP